MKSFWAASIAALCLGSAAASAQVPNDNDLRELRVGMPASALPQFGYVDLTCTGGGKSLADWQQWRDCPANPAGRREVSFRFDDTPEHDTVVAGQPVLLSLAIGDDAVVQSITMQSEPGGRVFVRKRGVHFGERVMKHYGAAGWVCKDGEPVSGEEAVGNLFIRQHCEKTVGDRHLVIDRALYRLAGQTTDKFVSQSSFTVALVKPDAP